MQKGKSKLTDKTLLESVPCSPKGRRR